MPYKRSDFGLGDDAQFHKNQSTIRYLAGSSGLGLGKTKHLAMTIGIIPLDLRGSAFTWPPSDKWVVTYVYPTNLGFFVGP